MAFWDGLLGRKKSAGGIDRFFAQLIDWSKTSSGVNVTVESSLSLAAVWACVRVKQEDIAKLPCHLYQRKPDGSKARATSHPLYELILSRPNSLQTAFDFKAFMQGQLDLRGNALAIKEFNGRGQVVNLWPVPWSSVSVKTTAENRDLFYEVTFPSGKRETFPADGVVHLRGVSLDGVVGVSPITYHRETIGLGMAAEKYGAAFFGNNAKPGGMLKLKEVIGPERSKQLREDWEDRFQGPENSHKLVILDGEMDWQQIGMDNADAQFVETRKLSNQDIYRIFRMPPHKVGDLERATFSNIEQQALEYVTDCLLSDMVRWEQTLKRDLLTDPERASGYFFEFMPDALMRGDIKSRYEAYAIARNWGVLSVNDIRDRENLNRIANGDIYLQPLNMIEAGTTPPTPSPTASGAKALLAVAQELVAREDAT